MHGDVDRREMLLFEALPVLLFEVRQGDEVAEQEAIAVVVVFDVQRLAHAKWQAPLWRMALRQALDEAEDALVGADANERGRLLTKEHAKLFIRCFGYQRLYLASVALHAKRQFLVGGVKLIVHQVADGSPIDRLDQVA